jgi:hypothetical protein
MLGHNVRRFRPTADATACLHPAFFKQLLYRGVNEHIFSWFTKNIALALTSGLSYTIVYLLNTIG